MPVVTASEVVQFSNISATAGAITSSGLIPIIQDKINFITNNYFTTDITTEGTFTFDPTAKTIVGTVDFIKSGFVDGDEIYIYQSYRNDGYKIVQTVSTNSLTLASSESVVAELSSRTIMISMVQWPRQLKQIAAQMVAYDYDVRPKMTPGVKSHTLGPFSETFSSGGSNQYGYPEEIMEGLSNFRIARLV